MTQAIPILASFIAGLSIYLLSSQIIGFAIFNWEKFKPHEDTINRFWSFVDSKKAPAVIMLLFRGQRLQKLLDISGFHPRWTANRFLILKVLLFPVISLLILIVYFISGSLIFSVAVFFVYYLLPDSYVFKVGQKRNIFIRRTLPQIIDLLRLQAQIGLNLETSIENLSMSRRDLWGNEFRRVVFETSSGLDLMRALDNLTKRFLVEDLTRFTLAVKQSKLLGVSLSETLGIQAESLRIRRRQLAEERAKTASVKISFPLVVFIFPAMLIIYLAPAVLKIMEIG